jgi:hypothetical protein
VAELEARTDQMRVFLQELPPAAALALCVTMIASQLGRMDEPLRRPVMQKVLTVLSMVFEPDAAADAPEQLQ